jgi:hypothetical protein
LLKLPTQISLIEITIAFRAEATEKLPHQIFQKTRRFPNLYNLQLKRDLFHLPTKNAIPRFLLLCLVRLGKKLGRKKKFLEAP